MKKIIIFTALVVNFLGFSACKHSDSKKPEKDKGPIYMRPIHHSKDSAQAWLDEINKLKDWKIKR